MTGGCVPVPRFRRGERADGGAGAGANEGTGERDERARGGIRGREATRTVVMVFVARASATRAVRASDGAMDGVGRDYRHRHRQRRPEAGRRARAMTTRATRMSVKTAWTRAKVTVARSIADGGAAIAERVVEDEGSEAEERVALRVPRPDVATPGSEDPWNDEKWQKVKCCSYLSSIFCQKLLTMLLIIAEFCSDV